MESCSDENGGFPSGNAVDESLRKLKRKLKLLTKYRKHFASEADGLEYARRLAMLKKGDPIMVPACQGWQKAMFLDHALTLDTICATFITFLPDMGHIGTGLVPLALVRFPEEDLE